MSQVGDLIHVAIPEDVRQLQAAIRQDLAGLTAAVSTCPANVMTAQDHVEWDAMKSRAQGYLDMEPSLWSAPTQITAGQAIQTDLGRWHSALKACGVGPSLTNPAVTPTGSDSFFGGALGGFDLKSLLLLLLGLYVGAKLLK
jgi:hypothetical protein